MNILFVCTANICRSAMAEGILKKLLSELSDKHVVSVSSAGVDALVDCHPDRKSIEVSREQGIDISTHSARQVTKEMLLETDLVICMQTMHQQRIISAFPQFTQNTFLLKEYQCENPPEDLEVKDPTGKSKKYYRKCFGEINEEIIRIFPGFLQRLHGPN